MSNDQRVPVAGILWDWQIIEALQENIKPEQISARPDGKDYVEWHEATRIANRVFGPLGWSLTTTMTPTLLSLGNWGEGFFCTRKITVRYRCSEDKEVYTIERDGEGWIKMQAIGKSDAIDMAFKGAASDAISKATKTFGDAFGLGLYAPKGRHAATSSKEESKSGQNGKPNSRPPQNGTTEKPDVLAGKAKVVSLFNYAYKCEIIASSHKWQEFKAEMLGRMFPDEQVTVAQYKLLVDELAKRKEAKKAPAEIAS